MALLPPGIEFHIEDRRVTSKEKRTFKERFFTRPWRPFVKFKVVDKGPRS